MNIIMLSFIDIQPNELLVTIAASCVTIVGVVVSARRFQRPFPALWISIITLISIGFHAWSLWTNSKVPASVGLVLIVALACWLGLHWSKNSKNADCKSNEKA